MKSKKIFNFFLLFLLSANFSLKSNNQIGDVVSDVQESTFCEKNKNILIAAGTSAATLGVGVIGGSFLMKLIKDRELNSEKENNKKNILNVKSESREGFNLELEKNLKTIEELKTDIASKEEEEKSLQKNLANLQEKLELFEQTTNQFENAVKGFEISTNQKEEEVKNLIMQLNAVQSDIEKLRVAKGDVEVELNLTKMENAYISDSIVIKKDDFEPTKKYLEKIYQKEDATFNENILIPLIERRDFLNQKLTKLQSGAINLNEVKVGRAANRYQKTEDQLKAVLEEIDLKKQEHEEYKKEIKLRSVVDFLKNYSPKLLAEVDKN